MGKRIAKICPIVENGVVCGRPHYARGVCNKHYMRWLKFGDPLLTKGTPHGLTPMQRFMRHVAVDADTGCWIWTGSLRGGIPGSDGYGQWYPESNKGPAINAHVWIYEQIVGPVPLGMELDHFACDNPPCCNPEHVRPTTPWENTLRGNSPAAWNAAKTHCNRNHEYTPENTYMHNGKRYCRACRAFAGTIAGGRRSQATGRPSQAKPKIPRDEDAQ